MKRIKKKKKKKKEAGMLLEEVPVGYYEVVSVSEYANLWILGLREHKSKDILWFGILKERAVNQKEEPLKGFPKNIECTIRVHHDITTKGAFTGEKMFIFEETAAESESGATEP